MKPEGLLSNVNIRNINFETLVVITQSRIYA